MWGPLIFVVTPPRLMGTLLVPCPPTPLCLVRIQATSSTTHSGVSSSSANLICSKKEHQIDECQLLVLGTRSPVGHQGDSGYWDYHQIIPVQVGECLAWMNHQEEKQKRQKASPQKVSLMQWQGNAWFESFRIGHGNIFGNSRRYITCITTSQQKTPQIIMSGGIWRPIICTNDVDPRNMI